MAESEAYNAKLQNLQKFIPFLNNMMGELKVKGNREAQYNKIQSLYTMITDKKKKLKLETLNRCEEVLNNLYEKVNPQMRKDTSPFETPRSPSPQRDVFVSNKNPITIPTEKVKPISRSGHTSSRDSYPPKIDIYSSAAESLAKAKQKKEAINIRVPDPSKPPISLDDLKTLEDDVQDKINSAKLSSASISQLNELRDQISLQLKVEEINKAMSPTKLKSSSKKVKSPEKNKIKDVKEKPPKDTLKSKILKSDSLIFEETLSDINNKLLNEKKKMKKEEERKKKEEEENKLSIEKHIKGTKTEEIIRKMTDDNNENKEEVKNLSDTDCDKTRNIEKPIEEIKIKNKADVQKVEDKPAIQKAAVHANQLPGANDTVEIDLTNDHFGSQTSPPSQAFKRLADKYNPKPKKTGIDSSEVDKEVVEIIDKNMKLSPVKIPNLITNVPEPTPPPASLVRLTMENKQPASDKKVELPPILQNMFTPKPVPAPIPKPVPAPIQNIYENMPLTSQYPVPEPTRTIMSPPSAKPPLLSPPVQNQFMPSTNRPSLLPNPVTSSFNAGVSHQGQPMMNFEQQIPRPVFLHNQQMFEQSMQMRPNFPSPQTDINAMNQYRMNLANQNQPFTRRQYVPKEPQFRPQYRPEQSRFNQFGNEAAPYIDNYTYDNCGPPILQPQIGFFEQKPVFNRGWIEPGQSWGEPSHNWTDNRGNRDPRSYREYKEMKEKEGTRDPRVNREQKEPQRDFRGGARDPRTPREPQEMKEHVRDPRRDSREMQEEARDCGPPARDPRIARDRWNPRDDTRDPRSQRDKWDPRAEAKETKIDKWTAKADPRDPRVASSSHRGNRIDSNGAEIDSKRGDNNFEERNRDKESRARSVDKNSSKERSLSRPRETTERKRSPSRNSLESKFDKVYSKTGDGREGLSSRVDETFTSPLDSLYSGKPDSKTGKGYGFQSFRIPKIRRPDPPARPKALTKKEDSSENSKSNIDYDFTDDVAMDAVSSGDESPSDSTSEKTESSTIKSNKLDIETSKQESKSAKVKSKPLAKPTKPRRKIKNLIDDDDESDHDINTKNETEVKFQPTTKTESREVSNVTEFDNDDNEGIEEDADEFRPRRSGRRLKREAVKRSSSNKEANESKTAEPKTTIYAEVDKSAQNDSIKQDIEDMPKLQIATSENEILMDAKPLIVQDENLGSNECQIDSKIVQDISYFKSKLNDNVNSEDIIVKIETTKPMSISDNNIPTHTREFKDANVTEPPSTGSLERIEKPDPESSSIINKATSCESSEATPALPVDNAEQLLKPDQSVKVQTEISVEDIEKIEISMEKQEQLLAKPDQTTETKKSEPNEQNILAHFFENLLKSNSKRDKKTALFSLIETFSDSFSDRELQKISKIIKTEETDKSSSDEEEVKKGEKKGEKEPAIEHAQPTMRETKEDEEEEASSVTGSEIPPESEKPDVSTDSEKLLDLKMESEGDIVVSVGERIKSRRRQVAPPPKPKSKHRSELDLLHEDIQEMFIRDGVLTASGKRMCRLLKNDPNALSPMKNEPLPTEESKKVRRKPGPKPKSKQKVSDVNAMKTIKVVLSKMPENVMQKRRLRSSVIRRSSTKDSGDESDNESGAEDDKDNKVGNSDQSDEDLSDSENKSQTSDTTSREKSKEKKKRKRSSWAAGIIPKPKKKTAKSENAKDELEKQSSVASPEQPDVVEPDKDYFLDPTGRKPMACKLCDYKGSSISHHYKSIHPLSEVLCSRLDPMVADATKKEAIENAAIYNSLKNKIKGVSKYTYSCKMCNFSTTCFPLMFYEHITTHTGEYRHSCGLCGQTTASGKALHKHFGTEHPDKEKKATRKCYTLPVIFGYMCGECNYTQLNEKNVEEHVNIFHLGEIPTIYKINMSRTIDPALEDANKADDTSTKEEPLMPILKKAEGRKKPGPKPKKAPALIADEETGSSSQEYKSNLKTKKVVEPEEDIQSPSDTDTDVSTPKVIYKKPGPKSKTMNLDSKKSEIKTKRVLRTRQLSKSSDFTSEASDDESQSRRNIRPRRSGVVASEISEPKQIDFGGISHGDKKLLRENKLADVILEGRGRAAKEKASVKLKYLMEEANIPKSRSPGKVKSRDETPVKETPSDGTTSTTSTTNETSPSKTVSKSDDESSDNDTDKISGGNDSASEDELPDDRSRKDEESEKEKDDTVKLNVFTCETDILQEDRKIEEERLKKMDELNKTIGSRTSKLDFVEKLSTRLKDVDDVTIKEEPKDDEIADSSKPPPETSSNPLPYIKAAFTKEVNTDPKVLNKKPIFDDVLHLPTPTLNFPQNKSNALFSNMIEKLQGHLNNQPHSSEDANDEDVNSPDLRMPLQKTTICDSLCISMYDDGIEFECCVNSCKFKQTDKDLFRIHCQTAHKIVTQSNLCEKCGEGVIALPGITFLESVFNHVLNKHATLILEEAHFAKPQGRVLRIRKLSGDNLSIKNEIEDKEKGDSNTDKPVASVGTLEFSVDNPFPFQIADVMSLAEPDEPDNSSLPQLSPMASHQPPPLTLIAPKHATVSQPTLVVKEAKMTALELSRPRKTSKAMAKFIQNVSDLYKCPHFYCFFSTNFRDFLEKHMSAHKVDGSMMTPCVYCDMKTPWEHVPMHIYIRHAQCRFACSYCLYRAAIKDYVFIHQDVLHPNKDYSVIALPPHKQAKKFAVADVKLDPKTLCKPYVCVEPNMEFLFENEFTWHLKAIHGGQNQKVLCGQRGCTARVPHKDMVLHWQHAHGVGRIQCSYCANTCIGEFGRLAEHFALQHPSQQPEYFVRTLGNVDVNNFLKYSSEAFRKLPRRKLNRTGVQDTALNNQNTTTTSGGSPTEAVSPTNTNASNPISVISQPVTSEVSPPKNTSIPPLRVVLPSSSKSIVVNASTLKQIRVASTISDLSVLSTVSTMNSGQTILLSPKLVTTIANQSSPTKTSSIAVKKPIFIQPQKSLLREKVQVLQQPSEAVKIVASQKPKVVAPIKIPTEMIDLLKAVETANSPPAAKPKAIILSMPPPQEDHLKDAVTDSNSQDSDSVTPVEHIELAAEPDATTDSPLPQDVDTDPLNIESVLADPLGSIASTSGDESDSNNASDITSILDKSEKAKQSKGLIGYELYRCGICCLSFADVKGFKGHAMSSVTCRTAGFKPFKCAHCDRQLRNAQRLVEHVRTHGVLRFLCSLCEVRFSSQLQVKGHMKFRHNIGQTTCVPVDANKNDMELDHFVVRPIQVIPNEKPAAEKSAAEHLPMGVLTFTPDQIDKIPIRQIFSQQVKCGLCHYTNKVRINIVRHLQMHLEEKQTPSDSAPVNPVPCLEKNEKMFDKMTNLAASSFDHGRMGGKKTEPKPKEQEEKFPEFIPTHCRFVCCAQGCSYLCPEEGNLRHHLIALHSDETAFTCSHCGEALSPPDADSLIKHFKLHSLHLYKCQYCRFLHHLKHKVERHVTDAHLDAAVKVVTIRHMESEPSPDDPGHSSSTVAVGQPKYKPWRCCMCKYRCANEDDIKTHVSSKHELDFQLKCTLCIYKTDDIGTVEGHFKEAHPKNDVDIIYVYRKVEEEQQKEDVSEPFDTTPLWLRDRPRVRHIRGILFDESVPQAIKSPKKPQKPPGTLRGTPTPPPPSSSPLPSTSTTSPTMSISSIHLMESIEAVASGVDTPPTETTLTASSVSSSSVTQECLDQIKKAIPTSEEINEVKNSTVIVIEDDDDVPKSKDKDSKDNPLAKNKGFKRRSIVAEVVPLKQPKIEEPEVIDLDSSPDYDLDSEFGERKLTEQFGGLGFPHNKQLKCPKCHLFKSKRIPDFIFHIFKDSKVFRYRCQCCKDESITYKYMKDHIKQHRFSDESNIVPLPTNKKLETWIQMVIREQSLQVLVNNTWIRVLKEKPVDKYNASLMTCDYCSQSFKDLDFYEHMFVHWSEKPYHCGHCPFQSYADEEVSLHSKTAHPGVEEHIIKKGPTVADIMKKSDDSHKRPMTTGSAVPPPKKVKTEEVAPDVKPVIKTEQQNKSDSDEDLVIVSNVDDNVPDESIVFGCDHCEFMSKHEDEVMKHMPNSHPNTMHRYHKITKDSEMISHHMSCNRCSFIDSEVNIRRHFADQHAGEIYMPFRYICVECMAKFLTARSFRQHFSRKHPNKPIFYKNVTGFTRTRGPRLSKLQAPPSGKPFKVFKCPLCSYQNVGYSSNNLKMHLKGHFKPADCGLCTASFRTLSDASAHSARSHPGQPEKVETNYSNVDKLNSVFAEALKNVVLFVKSDEASTSQHTKTTARKSTSAPVERKTEKEFSYYGCRPEEADLSSLKTFVEVNQVNVPMTVGQLSKMFNLNPSVDVEDFRLLSDSDNSENVLTQSGNDIENNSSVEDEFLFIPNLGS